MSEETTKYTVDKNQRYHRPNGQFASHIEVADIPIRERPRPPVTKFDETQEKRKGDFITKRFAHTFVCTCKVTDKKYKIRIQRKEIKKVRGTNYSDFPIIKHHYTISTNSKDESYVMEFFRNSHDKDYPNHRLIKARWTGWQEMFLRSRKR